MPVEDIVRFPLPPLAPDCWLFLWRLASMQSEALSVVSAWGFVVKSEIVWRKLTKTGKEHFGMGRSVRMAHEVCIVATRGKVKPASRSVRSVFSAPVGRHSEKPDAFYSLVETLCGDVGLVELFARRRRPGWVTYGLEVDGLPTSDQVYGRVATVG
jgi:N6-adenosine-specific RNA methylase IME4